MDPLSLPLALIEAAWNAVIRARPELQAAVTALDGRVVQITLKGLERSFFVLVSEGQLQLQGEWQGEPDATSVAHRWHSWRCAPARRRPCSVAR